MRTTEIWIPVVLLVFITLGSPVSTAQEKQEGIEPPDQNRNEQHRAKTQEQSQTGADNGDEQHKGSLPNKRLQPDIVVSVEQPSAKTDNSSVSDWVRFFSGLLLPWPFLVLVLLLYLFLPTGAPTRLSALLKPFQSIKLFGQEFVLDQQGGRNAEAAILVYRKEVQAKLDGYVRKMKLTTKHEDVVKNYITKFVPEFSSRNIRTTIHIPDSLFAETLYQLVDYYPEQLDRSRGRAFSTRYGIIGKAWRLAESQYKEAVPTDRRELILEWGMTDEEAQNAAQKDKQSFACVIIKDSRGKSLAVFYLDSPFQEAFGNTDSWKRIESAIMEGAKATGLTAALELIHKELLSMGPRVHIYSATQITSN